MYSTSVYSQYKFVELLLQKNLNSVIVENVLILHKKCVFKNAFRTHLKRASETQIFGRMQKDPIGHANTKSTIYFLFKYETQIQQSFVRGFQISSNHLDYLNRDVEPRVTKNVDTVIQRDPRFLQRVDFVPHLSQRIKKNCNGQYSTSRIRYYLYTS